MAKPAIASLSRKDILALLAESEKSKISVKDFLSTRGIKEGTFYYWRKKYAVKQSPVSSQKKSGFAVLEVMPAAEKPSADKLFAEVGRIRIFQAVPAAYLRALV